MEDSIRSYSCAQIKYMDFVTRREAIQRAWYRPEHVRGFRIIFLFFFLLIVRTSGDIDATGGR